MSNGDYDFLREYDEGEFRVWLAGQMSAVHGRLNEHRTWIIGAFVFAFASVLSVAGFALSQLLF